MDKIIQYMHFFIFLQEELTMVNTMNFCSYTYTFYILRLAKYNERPYLLERQGSFLDFDILSLTFQSLSNLFV